ncbi:hypothetical protein [Burkholderia cenocepacia]|uniref:hypothetical protein n=1 Tax=Burkholderia cenocepacia TaxID=95486 RepID=UPI0015C5784E|nr:hypothetical protein [Burkholderia cenocepacia]
MSDGVWRSIAPSKNHPASNDIVSAPYSTAVGSKKAVACRVRRLIQHIGRCAILNISLYEVLDEYRAAGDHTDNPRSLIHPSEKIDKCCDNGDPSNPISQDL